MYGNVDEEPFHGKWILLPVLFSIVGLMMGILGYAPSFSFKTTESVRPAVLKQLREPQTNVHLYYRLSPQEFSEWMYQEQLRTIDAQTTDRIRANHEK